MFVYVNVIGEYIVYMSYFVMPELFASRNWNISQKDFAPDPHNALRNDGILRDKQS